MVVNGEAEVRQRGGSRAVKVAPGQWVEYGLGESEEVLFLLVELGDEQDPRAFIPEVYGPQANQIPRVN